MPDYRPKRQYKNVPMFTAPAAGALGRAEAFAAYARDGLVTYADYRPKTRKACDECVMVLHEAGGIGPAPLSARHTRTSASIRLYLCPGHARAWKDTDAATGRWDPHTRRSAEQRRQRL